MENEITTTNSDVIQKLVLDGDLSKMSPSQKVQYYNSFCNSLGLNPLTQPFQIIKFQGKEKLYATKDCTEQLRKIHGVSITDITTGTTSDVFIVTAKAKDKEEKTDCSTGAVNIKGLSGDTLANAMMKAETKAKRRVTLSICGLGILDETETDTIKDAITQDITHEEVTPVYPKQEKETTHHLNKRSPLFEEDAEAIRLWTLKINECTSISELQKIFAEGKAIINSTPELYKLKENKKKELSIDQPA